MRKSVSVIAALLCFIAAAQTISFAGDLTKVGNAIVYPIKKAAVHTSIDVHRAMGHNSVVRRRTHHGRRRATMVETPSGRLKPMHH
jgi:hypothetical protein